MLPPMTFMRAWMTWLLLATGPAAIAQVDDSDGQCDPIYLLANLKRIEELSSATWDLRDRVSAVVQPSSSGEVRRMVSAAVARGTDLPALSRALKELTDTMPVLNKAAEELAFVTRGILATDALAPGALAQSRYLMEALTKDVRDRVEPVLRRAEQRLAFIRNAAGE